jgi:curli biogenesis system outer membrane secretion channel CsgG
MKLIPASLLAALISSSGLAHAADAKSTVEKCEKPLGTIAVSENQGASSAQLQSYGLGSPVSLLRIMIQQSNCFQVVERGAAMQNLQEERALAAAGEMQAGTNIGKGQLQAADFVMTPGVQFADNTGGGNASLGGLGGLLGGLGGVIGGIAGGVKFKEAQTSLLIADVRSGIQVAAAEGMAKKTDFDLSAWGGGLGGWGSLGGYTNTPEGKMVAASLLDNYNKIVQTIRSQPSLVRTTASSSQVNAKASLKAGAPVNAGESVFARLGNVKVYAEPRANAKVIATMKKSEEAIASGEERDGFIKIDGENAAGGWVQKSLVASQPAQQL